MRLSHYGRISYQLFFIRIGFACGDNTKESKTMVTAIAASTFALCDTRFCNDLQCGGGAHYPLRCARQGTSGATPRVDRHPPKRRTRAAFLTRRWEVVAGGRHECPVATGLVSIGPMRGIAAVVGTALVIDTATVGGDGVCIGRSGGCGRELAAVDAPWRRASVRTRYSRPPGVRNVKRVLTAVGSAGLQANQPWR
jgi:hypothetical protein